jgi:hypothetical protein
MNNQLTKQHVEYKYVPKVAKHHFEDQIHWWYDESMETGNGIPFIQEGMFYEETPARHRLFDLYSDVFEYSYASNILKDARFQFNPREFPIHLMSSDFDIFEKSREYHEKHETYYELSFFEDMRRMLMHNKMFFQEIYSFQKKNEPAFRHIPFGRVW